MMTNHTLLLPIIYQHPMYFINTTFMPISYQNPFLSPSFYIKSQNNQTENINFNCNTYNTHSIAEDLSQIGQGKIITVQKNKNLKKLQNIKIENGIQQYLLVSEQINKAKTEKSYKKKNTQSNVMNQTFSYMRDQNSLKIVQKLLSYDQNKIKDYYKLINRIKKQNKKYVNRKYLKRLMEFEKKTQFNRVFDKCKLSHLSIGEVRVVLRKLVFFYLRDLSLCTLLTSTKINKDTLREHFWRKRQIFAYLFSSAEAKEDQ